MTRVAEALSQANSLGKDAPELKEYQDEPPQMASGGVVKSGYLKLEFALRDNISVLKGMDRRAPLMVQRALYWDEALPNMPCIFMISSAGCILQGDRLAIDIHMNAGSSAHVTTQSATKIHSMEHNYAAQKQTIVLEENSYLEVMPDPVIPHSHSRFINDTEITIHPSATLLYSEILMSGRKHHSEDGGFRFDVFSSQLTANNPTGKSLFAERYVLEPFKDQLQNVGVMGPFDVFGNVILLTPKQHHQKILDRMPPLYDETQGVAYGMSRLPNDCGLIFKALGRETHQVKNSIRSFWKIVREETIGAKLPDAFLWR